MKSPRVIELESYDLLDSSSETLFDDIVLLAKTICQTPIAMMSFIDDERQWVKAKIGVESEVLDPLKTFCGHALLNESPMVIEDASLDPRFCQNEFVTGKNGLRFYAGVPVMSPVGYALGMICVIDTKPRKLEAHELASLMALARQVVVVIEMRRNNKRAIEITQALEV